VRRFLFVNAKHIPFVLSFVLAGCGGAMPEAAAPTATASAATDAPQAAPETQSVAESVTKSATATTATTTTQTAQAKTASPEAKTDAKKDAAQSADFLIMYNGDVTLSVESGKVAATLDRIIDLSEGVGGHLAVRRDQSVQIRVPSPRFREALGKISELGDVTHESVSAEDVSEEFHDAEVRLANMKATQKRLQDFLSKSSNLNDMLTLERELERVSMDIDRIEGRMRYLREHVAFSTLTIALIARAPSQPIATGGGKVVVAPSRIMHIDAPWLEDMGISKLEN
jgi:hypothetical protein